MRKYLGLALLVALATLMTANDARAWGAFHAGYTHFGPGGVYHYGRTAAVGPYGAYSGAHVGGYGAYGGAYHAGYGYGERYGGYSAASHGRQATISLRRGLSWMRRLLRSSGWNLKCLTALVR